MLSISTLKKLDLSPGAPKWDWVDNDHNIDGCFRESPLVCMQRISKMFNCTVKKDGQGFILTDRIHRKILIEKYKRIYTLIRIFPPEDKGTYDKLVKFFDSNGWNMTKTSETRDMLICASRKKVSEDTWKKLVAYLKTKSFKFIDVAGQQLLRKGSISIYWHKSDKIIRLAAFR
jgi:hypothetical protein